MKYETATAFRSALEARLLNLSRSGGFSLARLRKLVVFDRLMTRLVQIAPDQWLVKGGVALDYRLREQARTTMDLDLVWRAGRDEIARHMIAMQSLQHEDYFTFTATGVPVTNIDGGLRASRYRVTAELAGRRFEEVTIDVGFDYPFSLDPDLLTGHGLLSFAGISSPVVPAIKLERHLAEKLHAYTRLYEGQRVSTRVKDFVDMFLIGTIARFTAGDVRRALQDVFDERQTHSLPHAIPRPPSAWQVPFRTLAEESGAPSDVRESYLLVARFLNPVLGGEADDELRWRPEEWAWVR